MRTIKNLTILTILITSSPFSFAQDITKDTTLANSYFAKACLLQDSVLYDSATVYFEKASAIYWEHEQWRKFLQSKTKLGTCYQNIWQLDQAKATIKSAIDKSLQHINKNDTIVATAYHNLGIQFYYQAKYDSALFFWEKTLDIRKELFGEKHTSVANSYNNIGYVYSLEDEYNLALQCYSKALQINTEQLGEKHLNVASLYNNIGIVYANKNEYDLALQYYMKSLQIKKELFGEIHTEIAKVYNNIGNVYKSKNEYDLALEYYSKALLIDKELLGEKHTQVASIYLNMGTVYNRRREDNLALQYYFDALHIFKELLGEKHPYVASIYHNIGNVYSDKRENNLALQYYSKALQICQETYGEKHTDVAQTYINIGNIYAKSTNYDLALQYYFKAIEIYKELFGEKHIDIAIAYNNIGIAYNNIKENDSALQYYFKSLEIFKELLGEKPAEVVAIYNNIGSVYRETSECDLALEYYTKALSICKELHGDKHPDIAQTYNLIGAVYADKNQYNSALQYYQKAIACSLRNFADTINVNSVPVIEDYFSWDELLKDLQTKAEIYVTLSTFTKNNIDTGSLKENPLSDYKNTARADYLELALQHYLACDTLINQARQSIITKSDKLALGELTSEIYKGAVNVCINLAASSKPDSVSYYKEQAFYFSEKNKSSVLLEALAGAEAQRFSGIPDTLLNKEHKLQIDIALYKRILAEQPDSAQELIFRDKLFKANRQYDELITVFESQYPEYFELKYNLKPAGVKEIQNILDEGTTIISYLTGDSMITSFTLTMDSLFIETVPVSEDLAFTIDVFRHGLLYPNSSISAEDYKEYAYKMYGQLIPEIVSEEINNFIIIPDAELCMIPFEALLTEKPEDQEWQALPYLVKKYNISYSYSANLLYRTFPKEPTTKPEYTDLNDWLALAPVFDDSSTTGLTLRTRELLQQIDTLSVDTTGTRGLLTKNGYVRPLPATENEVQAIFKQFEEKGKKALVQIKNNANEEFIKSGELKKYRLLHFATHGFVNTLNPELSGILLAQDTTIREDGILYSGEIYNLKLNADLTVLSACETGLGEIKEGEGLIGLTRALLFAGSKSIIVSLWKVADKSTSDLMIEFYKNLLESKQEKQEFSQALRQAKLNMIDEGTYAHPFYWSPFILIGK